MRARALARAHARTRTRSLKRALTATTASLPRAPSASQWGDDVRRTTQLMRAAGDGFPATRLGETGVRGHEGDVVVYQIDPAA